MTMTRFDLDAQIDLRPPMRAGWQAVMRSSKLPKVGMMR